MRLTAVFVVLQIALATVVSAAEPVDLELVTRIRDEGFRRSQVMDIAWHLTDVIGARVTGSPQMTAANEWTKDKLGEFGLVNPRLEPFPFGRGWSWSRCSLDLLGDHGKSLSAIPQGWTPGTGGPREGDAVMLVVDKVEDLEQHKGKLSGKFVLLSKAREVKPGETAPFRRLTDADLAGREVFRIPDAEDGEESEWLKSQRKAVPLRRAIDAFLAEEGALGIIEVGSRDYGILRVPRGGEPVDPAPMTIPAVTVMTEQYNRLVRLVQKERTVRLRLDVEAAFHETGGVAYNTIAEIPGKGKADEIVMLGAHLDSYQAGTGAADNAAGVAVMMEAVRIIKALGIQPKRTIRIALWGGEEQGLLGSQEYVEQRFASKNAWLAEEMTLPRGLRSRDRGPWQFKPEHAKVSGYFNIDNGGGKIRGIHLQENLAMGPIAEAWLAPFRDLGVTTVSNNRTGGTDHISFDRVGIPGFQFIQEPMNYMSQTHHTQLDTYDQLHEDDLRQIAVVVASVVVHAANRDAMLPRKKRPVE
jgi:carboxypeptidase Q